MEWWEWTGWGVGVAGGLAGLFGAARAWRVDRRTRALQQPWHLDHFNNDAWMLTSNVPRTVTVQRVEFPPGWMPSTVRGAETPARVLPGAPLQITAVRGLPATLDVLTVIYTDRGRERTWRGAIPPAGSPSDG